MKLITETIEDIEVLTEANTKGGKDYKIKGGFMQADIKNRNGRVYPVATLQKKWQDTLQNTLIKDELLESWDIQMDQLLILKEYHI